MSEPTRVMADPDGAIAAAEAIAATEANPEGRVAVWVGHPDDRGFAEFVAEINARAAG